MGINENGNANKYREDDLNKDPNSYTIITEQEMKKALDGDFNFERKDDLTHEKFIKELSNYMRKECLVTLEKKETIN